VAQGLGGALLEKLVFDEEGQLLTTTFADYLLPLATDVPTIETDHITTTSPLNPLGIKGAGEAGVIPCHAVVAAALEDALRERGVRISEMPINPCRIWELMQR
jgi:aerobic carbon-monoxide dehydrogenase large subunit